MKTMLILLSSLLLAGCASAPVPMAEKETASMSETTRFKHHRAFPFCLTSDIPQTGGVDWPYLVVTLSEAMAFFWNLEAVTLTPTGAYVANYEDETFPELNETVNGDFEDQLSIPDVEGAGMMVWEISGALAQGNSFDPLALETFIPRARVCRPFSELSAMYETDTTGGHQETGSFMARIRQVSGEIRLYYSFKFLSIEDGGAVLGSARAWIQSSDQSTSGLFERDSGSFSFLGKSFQWKAYTFPDYSEGGPLPVAYTYSISGAGITVSDETYYTYPAP